MTRTSTFLFRITVATGVGAAALFCGGQMPFHAGAGSAFVSSAGARGWRPLTPISYAGVARRTTRRAVAAGAVAGAVYAAPVVVAPAPVVVVPAPVVVAPRCAQVVDAYGRITTVCR